jgi:ketosteroid isomerase-like protein
MRLLAVVLFASLASCSVNIQMARTGVGADETAEAMDRAWNAHFDAAKQKDAARACDLYTDDVAYAIAGSPELRGRAAVEAMEKASMATTSIENVGHFSDAVRVDGGIAHEIGAVTGTVISNGAPARFLVFHYVAVWSCANGGEWRIAHLVGHMEGSPSEVQ